MYSWLWHKLPGGKLLKSLQCLTMVGLALVAFYFWLFPWLDAILFSESSTKL
jgi:hypothetical protein